MGFFDSAMSEESLRRPRGGESYAPYQASGYAPESNGYDPSMNEEGAGYDPFRYTDGTLLKPWEEKFSYAGGSGGPGVADFKAFGYNDFNYDARTPGGFGETYGNPGNFVYGEYQSGDAFQAPTEADMKQDPGYQARLKAGEKALIASKAAQGIMRTGGAAKGLMKYGQEAASQEYGNVYNRRSNEYNRNQDERRFSYGTNRNNAAQDWDRNVGNARSAYQIRQGAWKDNAAVQLEGGRLGYDVAQGMWDRNYSKARQGYDDERQYANSVAAAGAAGAQRSYNQALNEYQMSRDEFWANQDRQYAILDREATRGYGAARDYAYGSADNYTGAANAQASGYVGAANARAAGAVNAAGTIGDLAMYYGTRAPASAPTGPQPYSYVPRLGNYTMGPGY